MFAKRRFMRMKLNASENQSNAVGAAANDSANDAAQKAALSPGMRLVVGVKLVQGVALAGIGLALLKLNTDSANLQVSQWLARSQIDTDTDLVRHFLRMLDSTNPHQWKHLGMAAFLYAVVVLTEGTGLWLQKQWAEILTIVLTASFIPLELYEVVKHFKIGTLVVMAINVIVACYLANNLAVKRRDEKLAAG